MKKARPSISIEKLIEEFKKPELRNPYPDFYKLETPLDQILWVLWVLKEQFAILEYSPVDVISDLLIEAMGIRLKPESVTRALAGSSSEKYNSKKVSDETIYKIMQPGIEHLQKLVSEDKLMVHRIGGKKPWTDKQILSAIVKNSKGEIKIVDPYYGSSTLHNLGKIHFGKPIKLLTARLGEKPFKFQNDWNDFKTEFTDVEIRLFENPKELHDRYILTKNGIVFLGHGIKDFGGKESFVIIFQDKAGKNILKDLTDNFDLRWQKSKPI